MSEVSTLDRGPLTLDHGLWTTNHELSTLDYRLWTGPMKIERFEDIEAWKKGRELAKDIYAATNRGESAGGIVSNVKRLPPPGLGNDDENLS